MVIEYSVLVKRDDSNQITGYYYPDFDFEHDRIENVSVNLDEDIGIVLTNYIRETSKSESIPFPRNLSYYKKVVPSNMLDQWGVCQIDPFFVNKTEKCLPVFGVISSIMAAITMAILNFYTTEGSIDSEAGVVIGSIGSLLSSVMEIIIYLFSDAGEISKIIGRRIDDSMLRKKRSTMSQQDGQINYRGTRLALKILLPLLPIVTTIYSSYSHYIQVNSVISDGSNSSGIADDSNNSTSTDSTTTAFFIYTAIVMIFFSSYSKLVFQLSFMLSLYARVVTHLQTKNAQKHSAQVFHQHRISASGHKEETPLTSNYQSRIEMSDLDNALTRKSC